MNTTALLVDILIIGVQVILWISGFLFSFVFPYDKLVLIIKDNPGFSFIIFLACSYTLGVLFDYIIALMFKCLKTKEERETYRQGLVISILTFDKEVHSFLDNQYARLRISRATIVNTPLVTIAVCFFMMSNPVSSKLSLSWTTLVALIIGAILTVLAIISWKERNKTYWGYIRETLKQMERNSTPKQQSK